MSLLDFKTALSLLCPSAKYMYYSLFLYFPGETVVHAPYPLGGHVSKHVLVKSLLNLDSRVFRRRDWKLNKTTTSLAFWGEV